jgi:aminoglycoside phosphotransferase family enzyme/predicted kinase
VSQTTNSAELVAAAMRDPAFYPGHPAEVEVVETHISWVFLAGERAYKLRKPVVFPFLDYRTPERRRHMCEEEVRLGRRLAPDVYLGVREVAAGGAVEPIVEMRRFDDDRTLAALLERGEATEAEVRDVARRIAAFHAETERAPEGSFGPAAVTATVSENFATLLPHAAALGPGRLAAAHRFAVAFLHGNRELLAARAAGGRVRDCHGDLRAEHVLLERDVEVFDPVEFDPALRQIDVAADLAFLVMELLATGREDLCRALATEYTAAGGDLGGEQLLWFYAAYRAWVRAKVACLRASELSAGAERAHQTQVARSLAETGELAAWRARRPLVLVICGGAATGKTHLALELSRLSGLRHVNSDVVRKELLGLHPDEHAPASAYADEISLRVYEELGARVSAAGGATVDATFRRRSHRQAFTAGRTGRTPRSLFIECRAPAQVIAERAAHREREADRASDADAKIAARQRAEFEPLDEVPANDHVVLRTDRSTDTLVDEVAAWMDTRLARGGNPARGMAGTGGPSGPAGVCPAEFLRRPSA